MESSGSYLVERECQPCALDSCVTRIAIEKIETVKSRWSRVQSRGLVANADAYAASLRIGNAFDANRSKFRIKQCNERLSIDSTIFVRLIAFHSLNASQHTNCTSNWWVWILNPIFEFEPHCNADVCAFKISEMAFRCFFYQKHFRIQASKTQNGFSKNRKHLFRKKNNNM